MLKCGQERELLQVKCEKELGKIRTRPKSKRGYLQYKMLEAEEEEQRKKRLA
jgi:hypothetical protein